HFVQRTRADIKAVWERAEDVFPERETADATYELSPEQHRLFAETHDFCLGLVHAGQKLSGYRRRMRYWAALALLRAVMSSPAAAKAALQRRRAEALSSETPEEEWELRVYAYEPTETPPPDEAPTRLLDHPESGITEGERKRLRELLDLVQAITPEKDAKLQAAIVVLRKLLRENFNPIVWCFYVATAEYVAAELQRALRPEFPDLEVLCVTGRMGEEERRALVEEFMQKEGVRRVLVATECLSEGVNLQAGFNAVLHYDLPWNPNRLEQREGRVDRYGQPHKKVKAIRFYGRDNPVDGAVIRVLLDKAREIRKSLGTYVPVPVEEEWVIEALVHALFSGQAARLHEDLAFEFMQEYVQEFHDRWNLDVRREKESRTRFAQRAIRPEEVEHELRATDAVLGTPAEVQRFVLEALGRLNVRVGHDPRDPRVFRIPLGEDVLQGLPAQVGEVFSRAERSQGRRLHWLITFESPTPEGAEYVGRNHPLVAALAQYLFEAALAGQEGPAARCGALRTDRVSRLTTLVLLRVRYLLAVAERDSLLAEEVLVTGFEGHGERVLPQDEALTLLGEAQPVANIPVGSLVIGTGVGREVYVRSKN
ncbi:MAG: helicase-related protein, partial [Candidatus Bipolaricaulaceae bacterium]